MRKIIIMNKFACNKKLKKMTLPIRNISLKVKSIVYSFPILFLIENISLKQCLMHIKE